MLRIERGAGLFPFLAVLSGIFDPCTQDTPLHFTESDDMQPNHKRSHEAAHYPHDTVNRGMVQSIRANGQYFINLTSIDFDAWFQTFSEANPTILIETVNGIAVTSRALVTITVTHRINSSLLTFK